MNVVVDDQCLSLLLRGELVEVVEGNTAFTTGYWYFRLCQAYFRSATQGALSRPFAGLSPEERSRAEERLLALPADIGLLSMRELAPRMAELTERHPTLNLLAREALAATMVLKATVVLITEFPTLQAALVAEGRECVLVGERS